MSINYLLDLYKKIEIFNQSELDMFMTHFKKMKEKSDKKHLTEGENLLKYRNLEEYSLYNLNTYI
jgi:hypothetical protein